MKRRVYVIISCLIISIIVLISSVFVYAETTAGVPKDGIYKVNVPDPAKMCKILEADNNTCNLLVKDGEMTAIFRLNGTGYDKVFVGTKEAAAAADASEWIYKTEEKVTTVEENVEITSTIYSYAIPVSELGKDISVATHSVNKGDTSGRDYVKGWYDRTFNFSEPRDFTMNETAVLFESKLSLASENEKLLSDYDKAEKAREAAEATIKDLNSKIKVMGTKVSGVKAKAYSASHKITVRWSNNSKVSGYYLYRANSLNGKYKVVMDTTATNATIKNHKKGKTYYYKVVGYKKISGKIVETKDSIICSVKAK